jgi:hypothetical protein
MAEVRGDGLSSVLLLKFEVLASHAFKYLSSPDGMALEAKFSTEEIKSSLCL